MIVLKLYPNRTQRHLKKPYKAHKYRLCRDLPICSRPTKNHPLVHPKIDLPGREKNKPLSLFITAILQHFLLYSTFSFRIQWPLRLSPPPSLFCLCSIQQSHLSLINQAFFLFSRSFSGLERALGRAWEWDTCLGSRGKKRSRARRISLKFIWLCFIFFMFFFTRTLGWVWVGREQLLTQTRQLLINFV